LPAPANAGAGTTVEIAVFIIPAKSLPARKRGLNLSPFLFGFPAEAGIHGLR